MKTLTRILAKQAGFEVDQDQNVEINGQWINLELDLFCELVVQWCLEKNRRFLFSHQASQQIRKDFDDDTKNTVPVR